MKKFQGYLLFFLLAGLIVFGGISFGKSMRLVSTWYASNTAGNGYTLGVDQAGCGTLKTNPCNTLNYTENTIASSGDIVIVNGGVGTQNIYPENSGSGYFQPVPASWTIEGDPSGLAPVIQPSTANARVFGIGNSSGTMALKYVVIDGGGGSGNGIGLHNETGTLTIQQVTIQNLTGTPITAGTQQGAIVLDRVLFAASLTNSTAMVDLGATSGTTSYTVKGCTANNPNSPVFYLGATCNIGSLTFTIGGDGATWNTFANGGTICTLGVSGTVSTIEVDHTLSNGLGGVSIPADVAITGNFAASNVTVNAPSSTLPTLLSVYGDLIGTVTVGANVTGTGAQSLVSLNSAQCTGFTDSVSTRYTSTGAYDALLIGCITGSPNIVGTYLSTNASAPQAVCIGNDGNYQNDVVQTTGSGVQKLGDTVADTYIGETFTTSATSSANHFPWFCGFAVKLAKVGTPNITLSGKLVATSAGSPSGSVLDNSIQTVTTSQITSSGQWFYFTFRGGYSMTAGTKYAFYLVPNQIGDGTDYITVGTGTAYASGGLFTGSSAPPTTSVSSTNALFYVLTNPLGISAFTITGSQITSASEGLEIAGTKGGAITRVNSVGSPAIGVKNNVAAVTTTSSLGLSPAGTILDVFQAKGSYDVSFVNCTGWLGGTNPNAIVALSADSIAVPASLVNPNYNQSTTFLNCILYNSTANPYNAKIYSVTSNISTGNVTPVFTNNDWYGPNITGGGFSDVYASWSLWQGAGFDTAGANSDPLLPGETLSTGPSSFVPAATSPAYRLGSNTSIALAPLDYVSYPFSPVPDDGAYNIAYGNNSTANPPNKFNPLPGQFNWWVPNLSGLQGIFAPLPFTTTVTSSTYTASSSYAYQTYILDATSNGIAFTLPPVSVSGDTVVVQRPDSTANAVTVSGTIIDQNKNAQTSVSLLAQNTTLTFSSDGSNWRIVNAPVVLAPIRVVTAAGAVTLLVSDNNGTVVVNKSSPATTAVSLASANFAKGYKVTFKDGAGNAATYPITFTPTTGLVENQASVQIATNLGSGTFQFDGTNWWVVQ